MKLGVIVSPGAGWSYTQICDLARGAEKSGFGSFWVSDHFFGGPGGTPDRNCLEAWTLLAALARDTTTIRRSEEHTSELQSLRHLVCRLLLEKKNKRMKRAQAINTFHHLFNDAKTL